jgi:hypothetical protein
MAKLVPLLVISLSVEGVTSTSLFNYERLGSVSATLSSWEASKCSAIFRVIEYIIRRKKSSRSAALFGDNNFTQQRIIKECIYTEGV